MKKNYYKVNSDQRITQLGNPYAQHSKEVLTLFLILFTEFTLIIIFL